MPHIGGLWADLGFPKPEAKLLDPLCPWDDFEPPPASQHHLHTPQIGPQGDLAEQCKAVLT